MHGIVRRSSSFNTGRIEHLYKNPQAHTEGSKTLLTVGIECKREKWVYLCLYQQCCLAGKLYKIVSVSKVSHGD